MSDQRKDALDGAVALALHGKIQPQDVVANAKAFLDFLEGQEAAAKPPRARKSSSAATAETAAAIQSQSSPSEPPAAESESSTSSTSQASSSQKDLAAGSSEKADSKVSDKPLTDVDVRSALVALQTRKGTRTFSQAILDKYTSGAQHVIGSLKKEDYAKVVAECEAIK